MRNLFLFIWKNHFFFLFLLLQALSFYLIFSNSRFHNSSFFNSSNAVAGNLYSAYDEVTGYFNLKNANELLQAENARLLTMSREAMITDTVETTEINEPHFRQKYTFMEAKVINNSINKRNNYLTLNKGSLHGIRPQMAVIAPDGVVGIVKDVSENFSSVLSLLNKNAMISGKLKNTGYFGSVVWEGGDPASAQMYDVPKHAPVNVGDTITTSAASAIFPEGVMLGTVENVVLKDGDNFYRIKLRLSTDFGKLAYVYVVNNLMKEEQLKLEAATQNDN
jgi:rod shape-determining protein MreC